MNYPHMWFPSIAVLSLMSLSGVFDTAFAISPAGVSHPNGALPARFAKCWPLGSIAICWLTLLSATVVFAADPPVELQFRGFARDKNWAVQTLELKLSNPSDKPLWFILPKWGDKQLPEKTKFPNDKISDEPLNKIMFDDREGGMVAIGVSFSGVFQAFRLPPRTVLEIPEYNIVTRSIFSEIAIVEAQELLVNGKIPLEQWLPFRVGVFKQKKPGAGEVGTRAMTDSFGNVGDAEKLRSEAENGGKRTVIPREKIEYIEVQGVCRVIAAFPPEEVRSIEKLKSLGVEVGVDEKNPDIVTSLDSTALFVPTDGNLQYICGFTQLRKLFLSGKESMGGEKITVAGLKHIEGLKQLQDLGLWNIQITDAGLRQLCESLPQLKTLRLSSSKVTDAGLEHLQGLNELQTLLLPCPKITSAGLQYLDGLKQLQELHLGKTSITDAGLEHLKGLSNLRYLILSDTKVTDAGLKYLEGLTNLQSLDLRDTKVTDAGVQRLKKSLPHCRIDFGTKL